MIDVEVTVLDIDKIRLKFHGLPNDSGPDLIIDPTMARTIINKLTSCLPEGVKSEDSGMPESYSPHPSGQAHGCPYDYNNPETNRLLQAERNVPSIVDRKMREEKGLPDGSFNCPICTKDTIHEHTSEEIANRRFQVL